MPILIERTSLLTVGASTSTPPCFVQHPLLISPWVTTELASAARLCLTQAPPLRAGDALHLALCQRLNLQLASFDRGLCKAAAHHQVAHEQLLI
jgi:hypothetical protein